MELSEGTGERGQWSPFLYGPCRLYPLRCAEHVTETVYLMSFVTTKDYNKVGANPCQTSTPHLEPSNVHIVSSLQINKNVSEVYENLRRVFCLILSCPVDVHEYLHSSELFRRQLYFPAI